MYQIYVASEGKRTRMS